MFSTKEEALSWLYAQKKQQKRENLFRIKECIQRLKIKTNYKIIHIAGTNGKGSTASFLKYMLMEKGYKVGFFISPFVICFNERIQVNTSYIEDEIVIKLASDLYDFSEAYKKDCQDTIPFFELTLLMALLYFQEQNLDYAVIECGLGGLLDSTNGLDTDISVITNIGLDHMQQLGNTLEEIALHKLGITRPNGICFTAVDSSMKAFFQEYARKRNIHMSFIYDDVQRIKTKSHTTFFYRGKKYRISSNAFYQAYNASLAIAVMQYLFPTITQKQLNHGLQKMEWPGRFEVIQKNIILDGAHNIPGVTALVTSLRSLYPKKRIKILFTALRDKAIQEMLVCLDTIAQKYYFTTLEDKRAIDVTFFEGKTSIPYDVFSSYKEAIQFAKQELRKNEILVITGSLHFISMVREEWIKEK